LGALRLFDGQVRAHRADTDQLELARPISAAPIATPFVQSELAIDLDHDKKYRAPRRVAD
jgi:hypothetical protein